MGKVAALGRYAEKDNKFVCVIKFRMGVEKVDWKKLIKKIGVCESTHFKRLREPESMTVRELREYINALKIPEEDVIDVLYLKRGVDMSKNKYEICQKASDGKWEIIAQSPNYDNAIKVADSLEFLDGNEYEVFENGIRIRNKRSIV